MYVSKFRDGRACQKLGCERVKLRFCLNRPTTKILREITFPINSCITLYSMMTFHHYFLSYGNLCSSFKLLYNLYRTVTFHDY